MMTPPRSRVLVVDDDPDALHFLQAHLEQAGYEVLTATDGCEALHVLLDQGCQIVVTDLAMPSMDGLALCRAIRTHEGIPFVYVVVVAEQPQAENQLIQAFEAGADGFLVKPLRPGAVIARLRGGERVLRVHSDLERQNREVHRTNAELAVANTRLEDAYAELRRLATRDELTGLTNRWDILRQLESAWGDNTGDANAITCISLDLDHFKNVNDTYGHAAGDAVLRETAKTLLRTTRENERVARFGGEEFLILLKNTTESDGSILASRLRLAVESQGVEFRGHTLGITVSLGVATRTPGMKSPDDLLRAADEALYAAKYQGRNRICLASTLNAHLRSRFDTGVVQSPSPPQDLVHPGTERPARILVVEPSSAFRERCGMLDSEGCEVQFSSLDDPIEGLDPSSAPDVVLLPLVEPASRWIAAAECLKYRDLTAETPLMLVADCIRPEVAQHAIEIHADDLAVADMSPQELLFRVKRLVKDRLKFQSLTAAEIERGVQKRVMNGLFEFARQLVACRTMKAVIQHTIHTLSNVTQCRRVSALLPDPSKELLVVAGSTGTIGRQLAGMSLPVNGSIPGEVFQDGVPLIINRPEDLPESLRPSDLLMLGEPPFVCIPMIEEHATLGVLIGGFRRDGKPFAGTDLEYVDLIANDAAAAVRKHQVVRSREEARDAIVFALAKLAEHRDSDTGHHVERVTKFSAVLARELHESSSYSGLIDDRFIRDLERAAPLHDIGKVAIPDSILNKPGRLTDEEMQAMRTHTAIGAHTIQEVVDLVPHAGFLKMAVEIARSHHEWFNGNGYPDGTRGREIPLSARVVAVADVYDALTSRRVYKEPVPHAEALRIITEASGTQFDPELVKALRRREKTFERLARVLSDDTEAEQLSSIDRRIWRRSHTADSGASVPLSQTT
ncbi:MAG: diguanylate cyclase [Phycisphaerae bacterium]|nr:diguanylate cyclase [Phycisphaerae bacterium]